jgi:hypothetical protein
MDVLLKAAEIMLFELSGSTAMLGSEFWPVSALAAFGMTSMTLIGPALTAETAHNTTITEMALTPDSNPNALNPTGQLIRLKAPVIAPLLRACWPVHNPAAVKRE